MVTLTTPEESDYTSIQQRIQEALNQTTPSGNRPILMPLVKQEGDKHPNAIGLTAIDYLELVDWAGRTIREGKRGAIPSDIPPILQRMGLEPGAFVNHLRGHKGRPHPVVLRPVSKIRAAAKQLGQRFFKGMGESRALYSTWV